MIQSQVWLFSNCINIFCVCHHFLNKHKLKKENLFAYFFMIRFIKSWTFAQKFSVNIQLNIGSLVSPRVRRIWSTALSPWNGHFILMNRACYFFQQWKIFPFSAVLTWRIFFFFHVSLILWFGGRNWKSADSPLPIFSWTTI